MLNRFQVAQALCATIIGYKQVVAAIHDGRLPAPKIDARCVRLSNTCYTPHYAPAIGSDEPGAIPYNVTDVAKILGSTYKRKQGRDYASPYVFCASRLLACWQLRLIDQEFLDNAMSGAEGYSLNQMNRELAKRLALKRKTTAMAEKMRVRRSREAATKILSGEVKDIRPVFTPIPAELVLQ